MNIDLHLRLNSVEELRQRIEVLNTIIISAAYHNLKEEPYNSLCCLRSAELWRNGENPYGGKSYPIDFDPHDESDGTEKQELKD